MRAVMACTGPSAGDVKTLGYIRSRLGKKKSLMQWVRALGDSSDSLRLELDFELTFDHLETFYDCQDFHIYTLLHNMVLNGDPQVIKLGSSWA